MGIAELIKKSIPFMVIEYYDWLKINPKERFKNYEILYRDGENKYISIHATTFNTIKKFSDYMVLKSTTPHGKVWEFMEFKEYFKRNKLQFY